MDTQEPENVISAYTDAEALDDGVQKVVVGTVLPSGLAVDGARVDQPVGVVLAPSPAAGEHPLDLEGGIETVGHDRPREVTGTLVYQISMRLHR